MGRWPWISVAFWKCSGSLFGHRKIRLPKIHIAVCDFLGEHLADFFGITTPKYQLEIEERLAILDEEKREQLQAEENRQHWSGRQEHIQLGPRLDAGDLGQDLSSQLEIVSEQPCTRRGEGDIPPNSAVSFQKKPWSKGNLQPCTPTYGVGIFLYQCFPLHSVWIVQLNGVVLCLIPWHNRGGLC